MSASGSPWDVIIIGAGASGLMCAATAGARGRSVLVLDHAARIGAKIAVSGGGRCNFTNREVAATHYLSGNPHFCRSALARFTPRDFLALVERHGIRYHEREAGQLFCDTSAREIAALLRAECDAAHVRVLTECRVGAVAAHPGRNFSVGSALGEFHASSLVVATGGLSYPKLGASGFGFDLARRFGLVVVPPRPGLVPFVFAAADRERLRELAGVSLDAAIDCGGRRFAGRILFTHRGLSGPAALQASTRWSPGEPISVDLLPDTDILGELLAKRRSRMEPATLIAAHLPRRLARIWCAQRRLELPLDQTPDRALREAAAGLHAWRITPGGTEGYATAEVTAGGVDTAELSSKTMEAKRVPGLHFVGEVVDVTGDLGGYNLHWAWASGYAAGMHV